jgi:peptidoglycan hydrolase-like protein with peptidoglycan-binding domain
MKEGSILASSKPARMRVRLGTAVLGVAIGAAGFADGAIADRTQPDADVAGIQVALTAKGLYDGPIDGIRGPLTAAALETLRRKYQLPSSDLADARIRSVLGVLGRPRYATRVLRQRMVGLDVAALQFELRYHGFPNPGRGVFGKKTLLALRGFQRFTGLRPDGVAGRATYRALAKPPPAAPLLRPPLTVIAHSKAVGTAVELACPYATPVAASIAGRVVFSGNRGRGYGYTVISRTAKRLEILYAHLARIDVREGQRLVPGAMVGLAGWTGKKRPSTSLRIELRLRGAQLDAFAALQRRR